MSFLYPYVVSIDRPPAQVGVGYQPGYAGQTLANMTTVFSGLPASIQVRREGSKNPTGLPGDATAPYWDIFIPKRAAAKGAIQSRDVVVDDTGRRFQVVADDWESLGYRLRCLKLET